MIKTSPGFLLAGFFMAQIRSKFIEFSGVSRGLLDEVRYEILTENDVTEVAHLASKEFSDKEPLTFACGISAADFFGFAISCCRRSAKDGVGLIARDKQGKIIGARI